MQAEGARRKVQGSLGCPQTCLSSPSQCSMPLLSPSAPSSCFYTFWATLEAKMGLQLCSFLTPLQLQLFTLSFLALCLLSHPMQQQLIQQPQPLLPPHPMQQLIQRPLLLLLLVLLPVLLLLRPPLLLQPLQLPQSSLPGGTLPLQSRQSSVAALCSAVMPLLPQRPPLGASVRLLEHFSWLSSCQGTAGS